MKLFWWIELSVSSHDDRGRGHLVDVPNLEPDDPVLDVINDADAVTLPDLGRALEQLDQPKILAVQRDRPTMLEADRDDLRLVRRLFGPGHELEDVVGRRLVEVLDRPSLG